MPRLIYWKTEKKDARKKLCEQMQVVSHLTSWSYAIVKSYSLVLKRMTVLFNLLF